MENTYSKNKSVMPVKFTTDDGRQVMVKTQYQI
jgi:hypothetical protein